MANASATTPLTRRIDIALKDGRVPQALELAKQFARQEPGPAAQALLRKCYLTAADAQVHRGAFRDAHSLLTEAEKLPFDDSGCGNVSPNYVPISAIMGEHCNFSRKFPARPPAHEFLAVSPIALSQWP